MLTASPSPRLESNSPLSNTKGSLHSSSPHNHHHIRYDHTCKTPSFGSSPIVKPRSSHVDKTKTTSSTTSTSTSTTSNHTTTPNQLPITNVNHLPPWSHESTSGSNLSASVVPTSHDTRRSKMVDAATQYSPPPGYQSSPPPRKIVAVSIPSPVPTEAARLNLANSDLQHQPQQPHQPQPHPQPHPQPQFHASAMPAAASVAQQPTQEPAAITSPLTKRQNSYVEEPKPLKTDDVISQPQANDDQGPAKRARGETPPLKVMPLKYELCDTRELVMLISSMLMELIRYNDAIPLRDGALTRFHSRAPPGISVLDYLQRLTTHATLSPPILLSMVFYIDKLCALYPAFTISSLTVHRFLITSATVASKGLSDSFWTNKTYARVGGVSIKELATLELEFLGRVQWRIVPKPEVLVDYYRSLVERSPGYELEKET